MYRRRETGCNLQAERAITGELCTGGDLSHDCYRWLLKINQHYEHLALAQSHLREDDDEAEAAGDEGNNQANDAYDACLAEVKEKCDICLMLMPHLERQGGLFAAGYVYLCKLSDVLPLTPSSTATIASRLAWLLERTLGMSASNILEVVHPVLVFHHFFLRKCHRDESAVGGTDIFYRLFSDSLAPVVGKASLDIMRDFLLRIDCKPQTPTCENIEVLRDTVAHYQSGLDRQTEAQRLKLEEISAESSWEFFRVNFAQKRAFSEPPPLRWAAKEPGGFASAEDVHQTVTEGCI